jgi:hypothetical protein
VTKRPRRARECGSDFNSSNMDRTFNHEMKGLNMLFSPLVTAQNRH